jgi:hypothetical protein
MMAQEVVIRPGKTIRFNLSINKSFKWVIKGNFKRVYPSLSYEAKHLVAGTSLLY